jgi:hypothetical protein
MPHGWPRLIRRYCKVTTLCSFNAFSCVRTPHARTRAHSLSLSHTHTHTRHRFLRCKCIVIFVSYVDHTSLDKKFRLEETDLEHLCIGFGLISLTNPHYIKEHTTVITVTATRSFIDPLLSRTHSSHNFTTPRHEEHIGIYTKNKKISKIQD